MPPRLTEAENPLYRCLSRLPKTPHPLDICEGKSPTWKQRRAGLGELNNLICTYIFSSYISGIRA